MCVLAFQYRSTYCVARTICTYFKMADLRRYNYFLRKSTLYFLSRNISTSSMRVRNTNLEVNSDAEKLDILDTKRQLRQTKDILEYMHSKESLKSTLKYLPHRILKRKRGIPEALYVVDTEVASDIVNVIADYIRQRNVPTFEISPGIGILSKQLLLAGVNNLHLCEPSYSFMQQMQTLLNDFPKQAHLIQQDLFLLGKFTYQDKQDGGSRVQELFEKVSKGNWIDDPVMIIIGTLPSLRFIRHLVHCHIYQTGVLLYGRPELYVIMSPSQYFYLTCGRYDGYSFYRSLSVLFQLIFQCDVLKKVPRKAFLPWEVKYCPKKGAKLTKIHSIDPEFLYLVKIEPHRDFFDRIVKVEELHQLWYFIWHHMVSRKNRVIPQLEKWIPGCGPRLIACNMTIHTEFGELTPRQILSLFHEFKSWSEYPDCPFISSMESMLMAMEQTGDEVTTVSVRDQDEDENVESQVTET